MRFSSFKIALFFCFLMTISEGNAATFFLNGPNVKKYAVTFGECYTDFLPGSLLRLDVTFKNITSEELLVSQELVVLDSAGVKVWKTIINLDLGHDGSFVVQLLIPAPGREGTFTLTAGSGADQGTGVIPTLLFNVIQPKKSPRLSKILVYAPDPEEGLNAFLKTWGIKAPMFSWAQVLLFGQQSWARYASGETEIIEQVNRALRREMSVIFLDFGPPYTTKTLNSKIALPFGVKVSFIPLKSTIQGYVLKSDNRELTFGLGKEPVRRWNGINGTTNPPMGLVFEGKGVKIRAFATTEGNHPQHPVVELVPDNGKGKLYTCQLITNGRLDPGVQPPRDRPEIPAYDPMAVQLLLNLISASVGDNLLK